MNETNDTNPTPIRSIDLRNMALSPQDLMSQDFNASHLTSLLLSHCQLKVFPMAISSCFNLRVLLLSNNLLQCIPTSIAHLHKLTFLGVDNNQLSSFPNVSLTSLKILEASNNDLCNGSSRWPLPEFPALEQLAIRNNNITTIYRHGTYPNLLELDISNNGIHRVPVDFYRLKRLAVCCNNIESLPLEKWRSITSTSVVDFGLISLLVGSNPMNECHLQALALFVHDVRRKRASAENRNDGFFICDLWIELELGTPITITCE